MKIKLFLSTIVALTFLLNACGDGEKSESTESMKPVEFNLTGNDQMQYNLKNMVVKEGQTVKINLKNIGKMPKESMGHNVVIVKGNIDLVEFAAKAVQSKETDYVPSDESANVIAHSKLLGPGEETTIEFTAPAKGTYKFLCTFPGHYMTMQGNFIVR